MKKRFENHGRLLAVAAAMIFFGGCASSAPSSTTTQEVIELSLFHGIDQALTRVKEVKADIYSPTQFEKGMNAYQKAKKDLDRGKSLDRVREGIAEATAHFKKAVVESHVASVLFEDATASSLAAMAASAPEYAAVDWEEAELRFRNAAQTLERGNSGRAKTLSKEADELYRLAELNAIKEKIVQPAWSIIERAEEANADRLASKTYGTAITLAEAAEAHLTQDRYDTEKAREIVDQARYEAGHAIYLAETVKKVKDQRQTMEDVLLMAEPPLQEIAQAFDATIYFDQGLNRPTQDIVARIENLQEVEIQLKGTVQQKGDEIFVMQEEMGTLEHRLDKKAFAHQQLAKMDRIRSFYTPEEATVLLEGDKVIIRVSGLTFPVGRSTISPEYFPLLSHLENAFSEYEGCSIEIQGHSDSTGGAAINQKLSTERAQAVREYILANMPLPPEQISAQGYGPSVPIANNRTAEGRALNRRIDVVIQIKLGT